MLHKYLKTILTRKYAYLASITCCTLLTTPALADIDKLFTTADYVNAYATESSTPNVWVNLSGNWTASAAAITAHAASVQSSIVSGTPSACPPGPGGSHPLNGNQCAPMINMVISGGSTATDRVSAILFLPEAFTGGIEHWASVTVEDSAGNSGFLTQSGDAAALAVSAIAQGQTVTYRTKCRWFNINQMPVQECGWVRDVIIN